MPTYALLGATGKIGGCILNHLLELTGHQVHCFVRSKEKLSKQSAAQSYAEAFKERVRVFEGDMSDIDAVRRCITGTDVVFMCVAASINVPKCRIAEDQAKAVVKALRNIRTESPAARLPKLVMLSSASTDEKMSLETPWPIKPLVETANWFIYKDLEVAEDYLRSQQDLVTSIYAKPGGLSHDIRRGHALSGEHQQTFISFADCAAGMIEMADNAVEGNRWDDKTVSILSPNGSAKVEWSVLPDLVKGLLFYYFPWTYGYIS